MTTARAAERTIVVVGDALLDHDVEGRADRLCPDAPVPVIDVMREHIRPGGAGLAAALAANDGPVTLIAPIADDGRGRMLRRALDRPGLRVIALRTDRPTTEKTRVRAGSQTVVRLDNDSETTAAESTLDADAIDTLTNARTILVSDYGLGLTSDAGLRALLERLAARIPIVWDPHPRGAPPVRGCRLVTPNEKELAHALGAASTSIAQIGAQACDLARLWHCAAVAVTLAARGAVVAGPHGAPVYVPAIEANGDACGAGDRFATAAAFALAESMLVSEAVEHAVAVASRFVATGDLATMAWPEDRTHVTEAAETTGADAFAIAARVQANGGVVVATGGCFDLLHAGHVNMLEAASRLGDCLIVCLNSDESVRRLKGPDRPLQTQDDRAAVLRALDSVDAVVVFDDDTPIPMLERLRPDVFAKGGDYVADELVETQALAQWGGRTIALPYLPGRSTSRLVEEVVNRARR